MLDLALEDPAGAGPLLSEGLLDPEDVAESVVKGVREERFLILPHPAVADYMGVRATQHERWLRGMRRLIRASNESEPTA
jgi:hypothetical protein